MKWCNDFGVDVVVMFVGCNEVECKYCGFGYVMDCGSMLLLMVFYVYSVVNVFCDFGSVFVYEVGYNFGFNYDLENLGIVKSNVYCMFVYGYCVVGKFKMIMLYGFEVEIVYFLNFDIDYGGWLIGVCGECDNVVMLVDLVYVGVKFWVIKIVIFRVFVEFSVSVFGLSVFFEWNDFLSNEIGFEV